MRLNRAEAQVIDIPAYDTKPAIYTIPVKLQANSHRLELGYTNNYNRQDHPDPQLNGDRNLFVDYVIVEGPTELKPPPLPQSHSQIFTETPQPGKELESAERILRPFILRAFRRPATESEITKLLGIIDYVLEEDGSFEESVQVAIQAILVSPSFLYRTELDSRPTQEASDSERSLGPFEFASRLSYFLWSSMPDQELFDLAASGNLLKPETIHAQVKRMLTNPKADALVTSFAGQWLQFRNLDTVMQWWRPA